MTSPTVLFPWVVTKVRFGKNHSIETGRDIPAIAFTSQVIVNSVLWRAELTGAVLVEKVAQLLGTAQIKSVVQMALKYS